MSLKGKHEKMEDEHMTDFEDEELDLDSDEAEYLEIIESWENDEDDGACLNPRRGLTLLSPVCRDPAIGV